MIWVYAVCEQPELRLPRVRGLAGAPLEGIALGPMLAVVSRHQRLPEGRSLDTLWLHEGVVEALMAERAVLPMRFGTRLPDPDGVRAALAARRELLLDALDRVRGRVELAVRAIRPSAGVVADARPASGVEYLRARLHSARSGASLHEPLAALAVAAHRWPEHAPGEVLRASYLVDQPAVERFRLAIDRLQRQHPEAALLCTGPWPAYSFIEGAGG
ncbi:MAG: gas vesicle protein [Chloroflexi bacterium]|nr:gas vesicle protein [Chloroflexota bacterium]